MQTAVKFTNNEFKFKESIISHWIGVERLYKRKGAAEQHDGEQLP